MAGHWFKLKWAPGGPEKDGRPPGEPPDDGKAVCNCPSRGTRRCTNEAVRSTRISQVRWPYPAGGAQCVLSHVGGGARCVLPHLGMGVNHRWVDVVLRSDAGSTQPTQGGSIQMPAHVIRDVDGMNLPSTAWPRQTRPFWGKPCVGHGGGRWFRLDCRARRFLSRVHLPVPICESGVRGPEPPALSPGVSGT